MLKQAEVKQASGRWWLRAALGVIAPRLERACLVGLMFAAVTGLGGTAAWAGCNSGNTPSNFLLSSANCEADATGNGALAVGANAAAEADYAVAIGTNAGGNGTGGGPGFVAVGEFAAD